MFPVLCTIFDLLQLFMEGWKVFRQRRLQVKYETSLTLQRVLYREQRKEFVLLYYEWLMPRVAPPETKRAVKMSFRCSPMTRARTTYLKRTFVRHSQAGRKFPNRAVLLPCGGGRRTLRDQMTRSRSQFKLAIRLGRFFSARAACAPARRLGISVWRTDFWVKPVRVI